jgi:hypothetical protein
VPGGADCYLLAHVLHDWEDQRATDILGNCRQSMVWGGRVLIVERLIPDADGDAVPTLLSDVNMLVITGGKERTNAEYASLFAGAGLSIGAVQPTAFPYGTAAAESAAVVRHLGPGLGWVRSPNFPTLSTPNAAARPGRRGPKRRGGPRQR